MKEFRRILEIIMMCRTEISLEELYILSNEINRQIVDRVKRL